MGVILQQKPGTRNKSSRIRLRCDCRYNSQIVNKDRLCQRGNAMQKPDCGRGKPEQF